MSEQHKLSAKKRWEKVSKKKRVEHAMVMLEGRWKNTTKKERSEHGRMMSLAKQEK